MVRYVNAKKGRNLIKASKYAYRHHNIFAAEAESADKDEFPVYDDSKGSDFGDVTDITLSGDVEQDFEMLIDFLRSQSYEDLTEELDTICKDPKLYALLSEGFGSGKLAKVKMSSETVGIPVLKLLPTQSEIGLDNSLKFPLSQDCSSYFSDSAITIVAPIVTYCKQFVVDGHHRWSQLYMINPKAAISAINFNYSEESPIRALRNFQGAVAVANKDVPKQYSKVHNVYDMSESQIWDYVDKNITDACWKSLVKQGVCDDRESAIDYITNNAMELKENNPHFIDAPEREYMPQTDNESIDIAKAGQTNL